MLEENNELNLNKLTFNLNALVDLGEVVSSFNDHESAVKSSLYLVMGTLSVSKGSIFQFDSNKRELKHLASKGTDCLTNVKLKLRQEEIDKLIELNTAIQKDKAWGYIQNFFSREKKVLDKIMASIVVPLVVRGELVGLISLGEKLSGEEYSTDDFGILSLMARQIGVSLHNNNLLFKLASKADENKRLYNDFRIIYYDTIQAFATAIDAKDIYTRNHSSRVSKYGVIIAKEMGLSKEQIEGIKIAGLLHDIGKITVDKGIMNKPAQLTIKEKVELDQHPVMSYEILAKIRFPWEGISIDVRHHHEKINGDGYPDRLKGKDIPVGAKILSLADAFDAMTTDRPYRKKLPLENTFLEIKKTLGKQFDPEVVKSFFEAIK